MFFKSFNIKKRNRIGNKGVEVITGWVGSSLGPSAKIYNKKIFIIVIKNINIKIYRYKSILIIIIIINSIYCPSWSL